MVDFIGSFNKGQEAAKKAEDNKDEIDSVFEIMNQQLGDASEGKLKVEIIFKSNPFLDFLTVAAKSASSGSYWAIAALNPLAESYAPKEIAKWKSDPNGYPCLVITDAEEMYCEDKAALEKALSYLLARPEVGKIFRSVMNQKRKVESDSQPDR
ncbi:hypothetical protein NPS46_00770 [Pseudomonas putida]|uniref:hypothetical protein n=1 Tax=Pseudomonas putida TaxID=303 RepID=UPI002363C641|nr:hypothetical protein [Pseudomonas putida]MDD2051082.1 hypothetical protein [Pseudomonas putida]